MTSSQQSTSSHHAVELAAGERFAFGANWARFLDRLDARRIKAAELSLLEMLGVENLAGIRFLDAGSGSGLFSLAAYRLGAQVQSFDFDPQSVACTRQLRTQRGATLPSTARNTDGIERWQIDEGSVLDAPFLLGLGQFDVVYSWGVLHHTGNQWQALDNVCANVRPGGQLFVALYNDQGALSRWWTGIKRLYNRNVFWRWLLICAHTPYFVWARQLHGLFVRPAPAARGMSLWYDLLDWLGGFPFEVSRPEQVFDFVCARGFELQKLTTAGGTHGCNQYVFKRRTETVVTRPQATPSTPA